MKYQIIIFILLGLNMIMFGQQDLNQLVCKNEKVSVFVEKTIYNSPELENFCLKFIIKNTSDKRIGVDLSSYWKVIYPNQWGICNQPFRMVVDEERMMQDIAVNDNKLINKFKQNKLISIEPNKKIEYYRDWNGSGELIELTNKTDFLIITVDGVLIICDGEEADQLIVGDKESERAIIFEYPLKKIEIPKNALIIKE